MARRLESYEFGVQRGRKPQYPWEQWTDGAVWQVVHGKDYQCTSGSLVVYLYHKARTQGVNVRTSIIRGKGSKPDRVVFQFWETSEEKPVTAPLKKLKRK